MNQYAITFARSARKGLEALSRPIVARVLIRIEALGRRAGRVVGGSDGGAPAAPEPGR